MKFSALVLSSLSGLVAVTVAPAVEAHIRLTAPTPRVANTDSIKTGPCGSAARNPARVSKFKPGEMVTVEWDETVPHPGYFRVLFAESGQNFPAPTTQSFKLFSDYYNGERNNTTADKLPKPVTGTLKEGTTWTLVDYWSQHLAGPPKPYSVKVTLPNVACTNCTLQVVQGMFESSRTYGNAYYYHCADIILEGDVAVTPDAGVMQMPDAGAPMSQGGAGGGGGARGGAGGSDQAAGRGGVAGSAGAGGANNDEGGAGGEPNGEGGAAGSDNNDDGDDDKKSGGGCAYGGHPTSMATGLFIALGLWLLRRRRA